MTGKDIKLLVVSPDPTLAGALAAMTAADPTFEVVGHASDPRALGEKTEGSAPSVVAISLLIPGSLNVIADLDPDVAALALDEKEDPERMLDALEAGANGYAVVSFGLESLVEAIRTVASGIASVPQTLLGHLLRRAVQRRRAERTATTILGELTSREREVFELAARGLGNAEVADQLYISPATARTHLQRVFGKLNVHSRAELVAFAAQCGLDVVGPNQEPS